MATSLKNLSSYNQSDMPSGKGMRIGILVSRWNEKITNNLLEGAYTTLIDNGVAEEDIMLEFVPGSFELSLGAQFMAKYKSPDAVICLGCVIQGETKHFDYVCHAVTEGINRVGLDYNLPVIFGVLTTDTLEQAAARAGGKHGNKGIESAVTAIRMVVMQKKLYNTSGNSKTT